MFPLDEQTASYRTYIFNTWKKSYLMSVFLLVSAYVVNIIKITGAEEQYMTKWGFHIIFITSFLLTAGKGYLLSNKEKTHGLASFLFELVVVICFVIALGFDYYYCLNEGHDQNHLLFLEMNYLGIVIVLTLTFSWWFFIPIILISFFIASIISANTILNQNAALVIFEIIIIAACSILYSYNYEERIKQSFYNKYESLKTLTDVFFVLPEGILLVDQKKHLTFYNPAFVSILGIEEERSNLNFNKIFKDLEITIVKSFQETTTSSMLSTKLLTGMTETLISKLSKPRNLNELHHLIWKNWDEIKTYFDKALSFEVTSFNNYLVFHAELILPNRDKRMLEIKFAMRSFSNKPNCILLLSDITQRGHTLTPKETLETKTKYLSSLSHELKTPVNRTINYIQSAINDKTTLKNTSSSYLTPALNCAKFLMIIINDLVDFSQLVNNSFRLVLVSKSVVETIREAIQTCEIQTKVKNIKIDLKLPSNNWDSSIKTDHNRLLQILTNLINNAVKHTFAGRITVTINREGHNYCISVKDSSPGMDEQVQKMLISGFNKVDLLNSFLNIDNIGLDLIISNLLARLLGPQSDPAQCGLQIDAGPGLGTTIFFKIDDRTTGKSTPEEVVSLIPLEDKGEINLEVEHEIQVKKFHDFRSPETHHFRIGSQEINLEICTCTQIMVISDDSNNIEAIEKALHSVRMITEPLFNVSYALLSIENRIRYPCSETCQFFKAIFIDADMLGGLDQIQSLKEEMKRHGIKCPMVGFTSGYNKFENIKNNVIDALIIGPYTNDKIMNTLKQLGVF